MNLDFSKEKTAMEARKASKSRKQDLQFTMTLWQRIRSMRRNMRTQLRMRVTIPSKLSLRKLRVKLSALISTSKERSEAMLFSQNMRIAIRTLKNKTNTHKLN